MFQIRKSSSNRIYAPHHSLYAKNNPNYFSNRIANKFELVNVSYHDYEYDNDDKLHFRVIQKTVPAYAVYVNAVENATVSTDTGDGTKDNPFTCFQSLNTTKITGYLSCLSNAYCCGHFIYVIVTGVINKRIEALDIPKVIYDFQGCTFNNMYADNIIALSIRSYGNAKIAVIKNITLNVPNNDKTSGASYHELTNFQANTSYQKEILQNINISDSAELISSKYFYALGCFIYNSSYSLNSSSVAESATKSCLAIYECFVYGFTVTANVTYSIQYTNDCTATYKDNSWIIYLSGIENLYGDCASYVRNSSVSITSNGSLIFTDAYIMNGSTKSYLASAINWFNGTGYVNTNLYLLNCTANINISTDAQQKSNKTTFDSNDADKSAQAFSNVIGYQQTTYQDNCTANITSISNTVNDYPYSSNTAVSQSFSFGHKSASSGGQTFSGFNATVDAQATAVSTRNVTDYRGGKWVSVAQAIEKQCVRANSSEDCI